MKYLFKIFIATSILIFNTIDAQLVVKNDTISGTPVSMTMDKKIDDLLFTIEDKCATNLSSNAAKSWNNEDEEKTKSTTPRVIVPTRELSRAEICRRNPRIMGYKIQLAVVKSNKEADEVGLYFRRRFPNIKVEKDASLRPNYKVLAGSYLTKESAAADLSKIRQHFKSALAIQYRVFCVEAK